jgi:3'-phosphoadenosine 5'-phosphosulfate sulfotransferase (PAPS reductase)/FAD synthetase
MVNYKAIHVSEVLIASIFMAVFVLMMEAVSISKTLNYFHENTRLNIPEDSNFRDRYHENLKSCLLFYHTVEAIWLQGS